MLFEEEKDTIYKIKDVFLDEQNDIARFHSEIKHLSIHHALLLPGFYNVPEVLKYLISQITVKPIQNLKAPNIFHVFPNEHGNILMEDIRSAIEFACKSAINEEKKIIVIYSFESISLNIANALLKILEEPPGNTFFLLIANETANLLPTIKSRCVTINFANSRENFLFLCSFNVFWEKNSEKLASLTSYNLSLLSLFNEQSLEFVTELEAAITPNFNYLTFKSLYKKHRNLPDKLFFLALESIIYSRIKYAFTNINIADKYFLFISSKKYVKLYNTNMELFLYCTIFNLCKNIFY